MLRVHQSSLLHRFPNHRALTWRRWLQSSTGQQEVQIDDIRFKVQISPADSKLVPTQYIHRLGTDVLESEEVLGHLRWLGQKYALGQDVFLAGHPGPFRRQLAFAFAEICGLEVEYLCLSKDTTESDLKQRKEIVGDQVLYQDQAPVRAALKGRLLILDGIEKAERNVLPTLNNLLENREMALEDGRFLTIRALEGNNHADQRLVSIHPNFRVIALGTPVPPYPGRSLDPPLRSRFQSRFIDELQVPTLLSLPSMQALQAGNNNNNSKQMQALLQFYESIRSMKQQANQESLPLGDIPNFSIDSIQHCATLLTKFSGQISVAEAIARCCPATHCLQKFTSPRFANELQQVYKSMASYRMSSNATSDDVTALSGEDVKSPEKAIEALLADNEQQQFRTLLPSQRALLQAMAADHLCAKHICILGDKGSGKSFLAQAFAQAYHYDAHIFPLYQELTSRDLLQRRCTHADGSTSWIDSPLIAAARQGDLCVLDGVHRMDAQALTTLSRFLQENEIDLPNGERLVVSNHNPNASGIHPNFRVLALGELPSNGADCRDRYFTSDLGLAVHHLPSTVNNREITQFVQSYLQLHLSDPKTSTQLVSVGEDICRVYSVLSEVGKDTPALQLSLRHILRLLKTATSPHFPISEGPGAMRQELVDVLSNMLLVPFTSYGKQFQKAMSDAGLALSTPANTPAKKAAKAGVPIEVDDEQRTLRIGHIETPQRVPMFPENVPDPVFHMNALHSTILQSLLKDYLVPGRAVLLMGNQGVGKNKLVDKLLSLLQAEREYIQLHRDSSIQSLTVTPGLQDGQIVYQDSPLVTAAKFGRVLVIDEVDKADTSVVCVLKALVEDGEVLLYDGRRLMTQNRIHAAQCDPDKIIPIHPDFKLLVLANRPGFPFLGNHFFRECGDVFSTHIVPNLDSQSEIKLLQAYGGDVPPSLVQQLVGAFQSLRNAYDEGTLQYPFSVREAVAVVRHLQQYPQDNVSQAVTNILAFDHLSPSTHKTITNIFQQHHLPVFLDAGHAQQKPAIALSSRHSLPLPNKADTAVHSLVKHSNNITKQSVEMTPVSWDASEAVNDVAYNLTSSRLKLFSEEIASLQLLKNEKGEFPGDIVHIEALPGTDAMLVLTKQPVELFVFSSIGQGQLSPLLGADLGHGGKPPLSHRVELVSRSLCADSYFAPVQPFLFVHRDGDKKEGNRRDVQVSVVVPSVQRIFTLDLGATDARINHVSVRSCSNLLHNSNHNGNGNNGTFASLKQGLFGTRGSPEGGKKPAYTDKYRLTSLHSNGAKQKVAMMWDAGSIGQSAVLQVVDADSQRCHAMDLSTALNSAQPSETKLRITDVRNPVRSGNSGADGVFEALVTLESYAKHTEIGHAASRQLLLRFSVDSNTVHIQEVLELLANTNTTATNKSSVLDKDSKLFINAGNVDQYFSLLEFKQQDALQTWTFPRSQESACTVHRTVTDNDRFVYNLLSSPSQSHDTTMGMQLEAVDRQARDAIHIDLTANHATKASKRSGRNRAFEEMVPVKAICPLPVSTEHPAVVAVGYAGGSVRFFDVEQDSLARSLTNWERMYGQQRLATKGGKIQSQRMAEGGKGGSSIPKTGVDMPKHGKEDPNNDPHVGGNTWAGGTGGSDTAGLGGRGGPYRLDKGHKVHQVSDAAKAQVSDEAKSKAREIAKAALAQRLEDIAMGKNEYELYQVFRKRVEGDIHQLKVVLDELSRRSKERVWLRHQAHGDLDDAKLVDGLTGERLVFKRRGIPEHSNVSDFSNSQNTKKRLQFVFDVSASMYRFNGEDRRLERMLEAALMIMESMPTTMGTDSNVEYAITGHSGDSPDISFLSFFDKRPAHEKERLEIMHEMAAHAQFTFAGDHTVEATKLAIENIVNPQATHSFRERKRQVYQPSEHEEDDHVVATPMPSQQTADNTENYVFVVSDANFDRYNIDPNKLAKLMKINPRVKVHFILIASLNDEARDIVKALPVGHGHLCFESTDLPAVFRKILSEDALDIL